MHTRPLGPTGTTAALVPSGPGVKLTVDVGGIGPSHGNIVRKPGAAAWVATTSSAVLAPTGTVPRADGSNATVWPPPIGPTEPPMPSRVSRTRVPTMGVKRTPSVPPNQPDTSTIR